MFGKLTYIKFGNIKVNKICLEENKDVKKGKEREKKEELVGGRIYYKGNSVLNCMQSANCARIKIFHAVPLSLTQLQPR